MRILIFLLFFAALGACENERSQATSIDVDETKQAIQEVMDKQEEAWNKGDLPGFMKGYWKSEELSFIGSRGVTKGWQQTLDNYIKAYPDKATMGKLKFETLSLNPLSDSVFQMIGKYTLFRAEDEPSGYFTLIWENINGQWVITSDQTCG